eukprot:147479_1
MTSEKATFDSSNFPVSGLSLDLKQRQRPRGSQIERQPKTPESLDQDESVGGYDTDVETVDNASPRSVDNSPPKSLQKPSFGASLQRTESGICRNHFTVERDPTEHVPDIERYGAQHTPPDYGVSSSGSILSPPENVRAVARDGFALAQSKPVGSWSQSLYASGSDENETQEASNNNGIESLFKSSAVTSISENLPSPLPQPLTSLHGQPFPPLLPVPVPRRAALQLDQEIVPPQQSAPTSHRGADLLRHLSEVSQDRGGAGSSPPPPPAPPSIFGEGAAFRRIGPRRRGLRPRSSSVPPRASPNLRAVASPPFLPEPLEAMPPARTATSASLSRTAVHFGSSCALPSSVIPKIPPLCSLLKPQTAGPCLLDMGFSVHVRNKIVDVTNQYPVPTSSAITIKLKVDRKPSCSPGGSVHQGGDIPVTFRVQLARIRDTFFLGSRLEFMFFGIEGDTANSKKWIRDGFEIGYYESNASSQHYDLILPRELPVTLVLTLRITPHLSTTGVVSNMSGPQKRRKHLQDMELFKMVFELWSDPQSTRAPAPLGDSVVLESATVTSASPPDSVSSGKEAATSRTEKLATGKEEVEVDTDGPGASSPTCGDEDRSEPSAPSSSVSELRREISALELLLQRKRCEVEEKKEVKEEGTEAPPHDDQPTLLCSATIDEVFVSPRSTWEKRCTREDKEAREAFAAEQRAPKRRRLG